MLTRGNVALGVALLSLFPVAVKLSFVRLFELETNLFFRQQCSRRLSSPIQSPFNVSYTGFNGLDEGLCDYNAFFHAIFGPNELPVTTFLFVNGAALTFCMFTEAKRVRRYSSPAYFNVWGLMFQLITMGLTLPLYWFAFIFSGGSQVEAVQTITQEKAESLIFGFLVGCMLPSAAMLVLQNPIATTIWQPFPVYMSLAYALYHFIRPSTPNSRPGHRTIQIGYSTLFLLCASCYFSLLWPILGNWKEAMALLLPVLRDGSLPKNPPVEFRALDFFKSDVLIGLTSSLLATLCFGDSLAQTIAIAIVITLGSVVVGPGAAFCAIMIWRESRIHSNTRGVYTKKSK